MYQSAASMFKNKKVLILGFGREGMSTYRFLRNMYPDMHLTIADKNEIKLDDKNVTLICGDSYMDSLNDFDIVMKSPGIAFLDVDIKDRFVLEICAVPQGRHNRLQGKNHNLHAYLRYA